MKELYGLKVRVIAVEVPNGCKPMLVTPSTAGNEMIYLESNGTISAAAHEYLPPGEWNILGRADELDLTMEIELCYGLWNNYCAENGLTNELILIEQP